MNDVLSHPTKLRIMTSLRACKEQKGITAPPLVFTLKPYFTCKALDLALSIEPKCNGHIFDLIENNLIFQPWN